MTHNVSEVKGHLMCQSIWDTYLSGDRGCIVCHGSETCSKYVDSRGIVSGDKNHIVDK